MTKGERTREFIIETAAALINKKGIAGTSISDIMDATNLKKGGIYNFFKGKDEICVEAFNFLCDELTNGIYKAIKNKKSSKAKIFALLDFYVETLVNVEGGCPLLNFGIENDDTNLEFNDLVAGRIKGFQIKLKACIEKGVLNGEFDQNLNADIFSMRIISNIEGAMFISRVLKDNRQMSYVTDILKSELERHCL